MEIFEKIMRYLVLLMAFLMHLGGLIFLLLVKVESSAVICFIGSLGTALFFLHDILDRDYKKEWERQQRINNLLNHPCLPIPNPRPMTSGRRSLYDAYLERQRKKNLKKWLKNWRK